jgi:hypothetical protein
MQTADTPDNDHLHFRIQWYTVCPETEYSIEVVWRASSLHDPAVRQLIN